MMVLFIDDDLDDVELFCEAVKRIDASCNCMVARNGRDGLELLNSITPDIIFLDINMPVMDGRETLEVIQNDVRLRAIPVVVFSTSANRREIELYKNMGAREFLKKPNSFQELLSTLEFLFITLYTE